MRLAVLLALACACYAPSAREGAPCGPGNACPEGQRCFGDVCLREAPDDAGTDVALEDAPLDAAIDAAPDAPPVCGDGTDTMVEAACQSTFSSQAHFFDIEAKGTPISITGFETTSQQTGARTVQLYYRPGTHVGFTTSSTGWTLLGTSATYTPTAAATCPLPKTNLPITFCVDIPANQRAAFYYVITTGAGSFDSIPQTIDTVVVQDTFLTLYAGTAAQTVGAAFSQTPLSGGHAWQGVIHYSH